MPSSAIFTSPFISDSHPRRADRNFFRNKRQLPRRADTRGLLWSDRIPLRRGRRRAHSMVIFHMRKGEECEECNG
jgi:hypothetical protein